MINCIISESRLRIIHIDEKQERPQYIIIHTALTQKFYFTLSTGELTKLGTILLVLEHFDEQVQCVKVLKYQSNTLFHKNAQIFVQAR